MWFFLNEFVLIYLFSCWMKANVQDTDAETCSALDMQYVKVTKKKIKTNLIEATTYLCLFLASR